MKRKMITTVFVLFILGLMTGCGKKETTLDYKTQYEHRELGSPVYMEASKEFSGGDGSEESPYEISTANDLRLLAEIYNTEDDRIYDYKHKYYILTDDIVLNGTFNYENWAEERPAYDWSPIGKRNDFDGCFDGNGHTIRGLCVNYDVVDDHSEDRYGLFAYVSGTIKNLNIENAYVEVSGDIATVGIFVGNLSGILEF